MWCLFEGRGTEKDLNEAKRWLQEAAAASNGTPLPRIPSELLQANETVYSFTEFGSPVSLGVEVFINQAGYTFD